MALISSLHETIERLNPDAVIRAPATKWIRISSRRFGAHTNARTCTHTHKRFQGGTESDLIAPFSPVLSS